MTFAQESKTTRQLGLLCLAVLAIAFASCVFAHKETPKYSTFGLMISVGEIQDSE